MSAKPPVQTSTITDPIDLSHTEKAKYVYVKVVDPAPLAPRFEGPYLIVNRPSRSTIEVRIGSYVDGSPRLQTYNWNTCKIAHLREDAEPGQRPKLGRPPKAPDKISEAGTNDRSSSIDDPNSTDAPAESKQRKRRNRSHQRGANNRAVNHETSLPEVPQQSSTPAERGKIQMSDSSRPDPHPEYIRKGPLITDSMFNKWSPDMLGLPNRPVRSTRNKNPQYIDTMSTH